MQRFVKVTAWKATTGKT